MIKITAIQDKVTFSDNGNKVQLRTKGSYLLNTNHMSKEIRSLKNKGFIIVENVDKNQHDLIQHNKVKNSNVSKITHERVFSVNDNVVDNTTVTESDDEINDTDDDNSNENTSSKTTRKRVSNKS